jgi:hypothetical protein
MSEDGGLEEVEESLRAVASCSRRVATSASKASTLTWRASTYACSRWQLTQGTLAAVGMAAIL